MKNPHIDKAWIINNTGNIDAIVEIRESLAKMIPEENRFVAELIFEEVFINIYLYAFKDIQEIPQMIFTIKSSDSPYYNYEFVFKDNGNPFNPLKYKSRPFNSKQIGGCGIALVKALSKKIEYKYENRKNILTVMI